MGSWEEKKHAPLSVTQSQSESQTAESSEQFEIELKWDLNVLRLFRPNNLQHVMLPDRTVRLNLKVTSSFMLFLNALMVNGKSTYNS